MLDASVKVGVKRKLDDAALWDDPYQEQRQTLLNVSMYKLQAFSSSRCEPSLLRSVLIYNTLKYIEHELTNEGITLPMVTPPSLSIGNNDTLDAIPPVNNQSTELAQEGLQKLDIRASSPRPQSAYHSITPLTAAKLSGLPAVAQSPVPVRTDVLLPTAPLVFHSHGVVPWSSDSPSAANYHPPVHKPLHKLSVPPNVNAQVDFNYNNTAVAKRDVTSDVRMLAAPSISEKTDDDLFGDIDIDFALYDFDLFSPMSQKLPPISADELCHVIPASAAGAADGYGPNTPYNAASAQVGSCKTDVICDDLDHIMQVLVGM